MKVSVIIVNYNVEYFLEQCLHSVKKSAEGMDVEIVVVDNASVDGSIKMIQEKFPDVTLIANKENLGFSKANNIGINKSSGEYVLLLNPDTVVQEDTLKVCTDYMDSRPNAGGAGVMMLDGKGEFLPESKRGLPTPEVAFYKIFGLSALFPKSKRFNQYHLGHLDREQNHEIEILSGAYMFLRRSALEKTGLLDENFFMYGEDIDLSYRLVKAGYSNHYIADSRIIHYKGESTKRSSVNYVFVFYNAMVIFAKKHFSSKNAKLFSILINLAIYIRAAIALVMRVIRRSLLPLLEFGLLIGTLLLVKQLYEIYSGKNIPTLLYQIAFPAYSLIWIVSMALQGAYRRFAKLKNVVLGLMIGTAAILILYSLVSDDYRFSRAIIIIGSVAGMLSLLIMRKLLTLIWPGLRLGGTNDRKYALVGEKEEVDRVLQLMEKSMISTDRVFLLNSSGEGEGISGSIDQLKDVVGVHEVTDVVFCAKDVAARTIMDKMTEVDSPNLSFKIAPPESLFIIGSDSAQDSGEFLTFELNSVARTENRYKKRIFDILSSIVILSLSPLLLFVQKRPLTFFPNTLKVLFGQRSWVGYNPNGDISGLPKLRPGVLFPSMEETPQHCDTIGQSNVLYSKNYKWGNDLDLLLEHIRRLGN